MVGVLVAVTAAALAQSSGPASCPAERLFRIWREEAKELDPALVEHYEAVLGKVLGGYRLRPEDEPAYRRSVRRFLEQHAFLRKGREKPSFQIGVVNWLAYCKRLALERSPLDAAELRSLRAEYRALFREIMTLVRNQLLEAAPWLEGEPMQAVDAEFEKAEALLSSRLTELQEDYLYPGFKRPMAPKYREGVVRFFREWIDYPGGPASLAQSSAPSIMGPPESQTFSARSRVRNLPMNVLFRMLCETMYQCDSGAAWTRAFSGSSGGGTPEGLWPGVMLRYTSGDAATTRRVRP